MTESDQDQSEYNSSNLGSEEEVYYKRNSGFQQLEQKFVHSVEEIVQEFIDDSNNLQDLSRYYSDNSCFSIMFAKANKVSPISKLFEHNHNLFYSSNSKIHTPKGAKEILELQRKLFPEGIKMNNTKFFVQLVSNLFFSVNIEGTTFIDGTEYMFNRTIIILEENNYFVISNDILVFRFSHE